MKQKILLMLVAFSFIVGANAQKKSKPVTAYAITAAEKGNSKWTEVRLVNLNTGDEIQSIYNSSVEVSTLNARTGKPIVKKEMASKAGNSDRDIMIFRSKDKKALTEAEAKELMATTKFDGKEKIRIERRIDVKNGVDVTTKVDVRPNVNVVVRKIMRTRINSYAPFATQSAACAYDKKHDRLYYTPMGINQLRYIDLKSKTPQIFYFEDEPLGALSGPAMFQIR